MTFERFLLLPLLIGMFCAGCTTSSETSSSSGGGLSDFNREPLVGVWEVTAYRQTYTTASAEKRFAANVKYCFTKSRVYPELAPEAATDTRDGWAPYYMTNDMLVLKLPSGESMFGIRMLSAEQMTLTQNGLEMTLRKIGATVDANNLSTPVLPRKMLPVQPLQPVTPTPAHQPSPSPKPAAL